MRGEKQEGINNIFKNIREKLKNVSRGEFELDVCAFKRTAQCKKYFTPREQPWKKKWKELNWLHLPKENSIKYLRKAFKEANLNQNVTLVLLPSDAQSREFIYCFYNANQIILVDEKVNGVGYCVAAFNPSNVERESAEIGYTVYKAYNEKQQDEETDNENISSQSSTDFN